MSDDGKGLDYWEIGQKALSLKLIKKEDLNNKDLLMKVIFAPGFSTAPVEGNHECSGVGLNHVRNLIKETNGSLKINSIADKGTAFFVSLPLQDLRQTEILP